MKLTDLQEGLQKRRVRRQRSGWVVYDSVNELYASGPRNSRSDDIQDLHIFEDEESATKAQQLLGRHHENDLSMYGDKTELAKMIIAEPDRNWNWHGNGWKGDDPVKWAKSHLDSQPPDKDRWQVRKVRVTYDF